MTMSKGIVSIEHVDEVLRDLSQEDRAILEAALDRLAHCLQLLLLGADKLARSEALTTLQALGYRGADERGPE